MMLPSVMQNVMQKMKKAFPALTAVLLLVCAPAAFANAPVASIVIDNKVMQFSPSPIQINSNTLAAVKPLAESLEAHVNWDATTRVVTLSKFGRKVEIAAEKQEVKINGKLYYSDVPSTIQNGSLYAPLQFTCKALGADVVENNGVVSVNSTPSYNVVPTSAPKPSVQLAAIPQPVESVTADGFDPVLVAIQQKIPGAVLTKKFLGLHGDVEVQHADFPKEHIYVINESNNMEIFTYFVAIDKDAKSEKSLTIVKAVLEELSKDHATEIYTEYEKFILSEEKEHKPFYFGGQKVIFKKWADKNGEYNIADISFFR